MRLAEPAAQATKQTTDGIGEVITQHLTTVLHSAYCRARRVEDRDRRLFSQFYATGFSQFVVSLYNSGFHVGSCTVVAISRCKLVPVAPALPSQGPGLCAVPARGALAILRGHSGSALHPRSQKCPISADTLQAKGRDRSLL